MIMEKQNTEVSPVLFFDTVNAYQRTAALRSAVELDLFTAVTEGKETTRALAERCGAAERGIRILCDYLVMIGFLTKTGDRYGPTADTAAFLDRRSPAFVGGAVEFLLSPTLTQGFRDLTACVRKGGTALPEAGVVAPEHPVWVQFARAMVPLMALPAQLLARLVDPEARGELKVLDIAAGHGLFGIEFARRNPGVHLLAQDWPQVLEVARENARAAGVEDRFSTLPGSAFEVEYGSGYDLILLTNFLHHFDRPTCEALLRKVHAALAEGGRAVTLEFIPNEDRVSPPGSAGFSLVMLAATPGGDAYTFSELEAMCRNAGFSRSELHPLPPSFQHAVISHR
jgi:predicted nicotinamide N-methyase